MKKINFFNADVKFNLKQKRDIKKLIKRIFEEEQVMFELIDYVFCSDEYLLQINQSFLNHNYFTDVLTFTLSNLENPIQGEIYISTERIKENAKFYACSYEKELLRVMIHGVLHLCGYNDKNENEKREMRKKENHYLKIFFWVPREN